MQMNRKLLSLAVVGLAVLCLAPTRRAELDHVGAYNFMVEISGVNAGYFKGVDGLTAVFERSNTEQVSPSAVTFRAGRALQRDRARQVKVRVNIVLERDALGLKKGRICGLNFTADVVRTRKNGLRLQPTSPATDDCGVLREAR